MAGRTETVYKILMHHHLFVLHSRYLYYTACEETKFPLWKLASSLEICCAAFMHMSVYAHI